MRPMARQGRSRLLRISAAGIEDGPARFVMGERPMLDLNATTDHAIDLPAGRDDRDERARVMLLALGDNMIGALRRLDGERGAALGCALRDFVLSGEVAPAYWPIDEAIEILSRDREDCRASAVLHAIFQLRAIVGIP